MARHQLVRGLRVLMFLPALRQHVFFLRLQHGEFADLLQVARQRALGRGRGCEQLRFRFGHLGPQSGPSRLPEKRGREPSGQFLFSNLAEPRHRGPPPDNTRRLQSGYSIPKRGRNHVCSTSCRGAICRGESFGPPEPAYPIWEPGTGVKERSLKNFSCKRRCELVRIIPKTTAALTEVSTLKLCVIFFSSA